MTFPIEKIIVHDFSYKKYNTGKFSYTKVDDFLWKIHR